MTERKPRALIIDDEADIRELLDITLARMGIDTVAAENVAAAKQALAEAPFDLCLTDMRLPDGSGLDIVEHIQAHCPHLPVAVITAYGSMELAIQALKAGAFDFVSKPVELKVLRKLVEQALKSESGSDAGRPDMDRRLIGEAPVMCSLKEKVDKLARGQAPVFISGESGTGKEVIARLIHERGPRGEGPFVPVNCGAIPAELMESEFFGHKKGSFTGASQDKPGLFQAADGGTLFLDEVADLPLSMQVKLLRAIQEKRVRPLGAHQEIPIDVRILSATHRPLQRLVDEGRFREDLYYRINVIELQVPPLRERPQDIPLLVTTLLERLGEQYGQRFALDAAALETLGHYAFPGNVRELENILERAATLCENGRIRREDLGLKPERRQAMPPAPSHRVCESERDSIIQALETTRWNRTAAARELGLTLRQLRYRLEKLDID